MAGLVKLSQFHVYGMVIVAYEDVYLSAYTVDAVMRPMAMSDIGLDVQPGKELLFPKDATCPVMFAARLYPDSTQYRLYISDVPDGFAPGKRLHRDSLKGTRYIQKAVGIAVGSLLAKTNPAFATKSVLGSALADFWNICEPDNWTDSDTSAIYW